MSPAAAQQQQQQQATGANAKQKKELVDLECDDEFEEFNEEGARRSFLGIVLKYKMRKERSVFLFSLFFLSRARSLSLSLSLSLFSVPLLSRGARILNWLTLRDFTITNNRVDERKRGEGRRGAVGGRLGRHGSGRFQDAFERGVEEEHSKIIFFS